MPIQDTEGFETLTATHRLRLLLSQWNRQHDAIPWNENQRQGILTRETEAYIELQRTINATEKLERYIENKLARLEGIIDYVKESE